MLKVEVLTGASTAATPRAWCLRPSASCARCWTGWKTARPGLLPESFHCEIPGARLEQARATAAILKDEVYKRLPWACGADGLVLPMTTDPVEVLLNRTWRPTHVGRGRGRLPELKNAGNVLRPTRPSASACACRRWWTAMRPRCSSRRC